MVDLAALAEIETRIRVVEDNLRQLWPKDQALWAEFVSYKDAVETEEVHVDILLGRSITLLFSNQLYCLRSISSDTSQ